MMPILLPVLVRRSMRETTVAATLPAVAPVFTARENSAQDLHPQALQHGRVVVERMAGQEEADRVIFAAQPLGRQPRLDLRQHDGRRVRRVAEHVVLADGRGLMAALAGGEDRIRAGKDARAVGLQRVEGAGGGEALDDALVDRARIDPRGEIRKRGEQALLALLDDHLDRLRTDALERGKRVIDRVLADLEGRAGAVDVGRPRP